METFVLNADLRGEFKQPHTIKYNFPDFPKKNPNALSNDRPK